MARTWNGGLGGQCSVRRAEGESFCKRHSAGDAWRTHGRLDGPIPAPKMREFLRCGSPGTAAKKVSRPLAPAADNSSETAAATSSASHFPVVKRPAFHLEHSAVVSASDVWGSAGISLPLATGAGRSAAKVKRSKHTSVKNQLPPITPSALPANYIQVFTQIPKPAPMASHAAVEEHQDSQKKSTWMDALFFSSSPPLETKSPRCLKLP